MAGKKKATKERAAAELFEGLDMDKELEITDEEAENVIVTITGQYEDGLEESELLEYAHQALQAAKEAKFMALLWRLVLAGKACVRRGEEDWEFGPVRRPVKP